MRIVALVMAIVGLGALVAAVVTKNEIIAWACIGISAIGVALLIIDALLARRGHAAESAATADEVLPFDADYADEAASDRTATDTPIHGGGHAVQREIIREERVLHSDTGPRDPDVGTEEMLEAIRHRRRHSSTHRAVE